MDLDAARRALAAESGYQIRIIELESQLDLYIEQKNQYLSAAESANRCMGSMRSELKEVQKSERTLRRTTEAVEIELSSCRLHLNNSLEYSASLQLEIDQLNNTIYDLRNEMEIQAYDLEKTRQGQVELEEKYDMAKAQVTVLEGECNAILRQLVDVRNAISESELGSGVLMARQSQEIAVERFEHMKVNLRNVNAERVALEGEKVQLKSAYEQLLLENNMLKQQVGTADDNK